MILYDTPFSVYDTILYDTILYDIHNPNSEASNKATISRLTDRSGFLYDGCKLAEDRSGFPKNRNSLRHRSPSNQSVIHQSIAIDAPREHFSPRLVTSRRRGYQSEETETC